MLRLSAFIVILAALLVLAGAGPGGVNLAAGPPDPAPSRGSGQPQATASRDVAIASVAKAGSAFEAVLAGTVVTINVVVQNLGTTGETFQVRLADETDDREIITVSLTLAAGEQVTLGLPWDTTGASYEDDLPPPDARPHSLQAQAILEGDGDTSNNASSTGLLPGAAILIQKNPSPPTDPAPGLGPVPQITFPDNLAQPQASFGQGQALQNPGIGTRGRPVAGFWVGPVDAQWSSAFSAPAIATAGQAQRELFVGGTAVSYRPGQILLNPFRQGEVAGQLRLQQRDSSLGAYLQAGSSLYFVQTDGTFRAPLPAGVWDLYLRAPGYLPALLPAVVIEPGDLVTIPPMTLPFGDVNGDGRIDILDLSIAAGNFSQVAATQELP